MTESEIDRLCELTNIGAGHAATAFSELAGRTIWMHVPHCVDEPAAQAADDWSSGVFFEVEGGIGGLVGLLFRSPMRESLVRRLLGEAAASPAEVESALMEVGNILVSRVASAIADTLDARILPSVPTLVMDGAGRELEELARRRSGDDPIRIDCELTDEDGEIGGLLVFFPELPSTSE
jgi:chemotaxis protein CheC